MKRSKKDASEERKIPEKDQQERGGGRGEEHEHQEVTTIMMITRSKNPPFLYFLFSAFVKIVFLSLS